MQGEQLLFVGFLMYIAYMDWKQLRIPNWSLFALLLFKVVSLAGTILSHQPGEEEVTVQLFKSSMLGGSMAFVLALFCYLLAKGSLGAGDVKLIGIMGLYLGQYRILGCLAIAYVLAGILGIFLLLFRKIHRKDPMPFAPFLCVAAVWGMLWKG